MDKLDKNEQNINTGEIDQTNMADTRTQNGTYDIPLVFMKESSLFGNRAPAQAEWIKHVDLFCAIGQRIDESHIKGLQRIRGMWRIYLDNIGDKVILMAEGVPLRGKIVPVLGTNPDRLDGENTIRIRIKNIPLSVDDGVITRQFTLADIDPISCLRDKLRVRGKLTNCETGDRIITVKASSLKAPLPKFMRFGKFTGRVIHYGQQQPENIRPKKCTKCFESGHVFAECSNDWVCSKCMSSGHKQTECLLNARSSGTDYDSDNSEDRPSESEDNEESGEDMNQTMKLVPPMSSPKPTEGEPSKIPVNHETSNTAKVQQQMDKFLNKSETPNKGRQLNATDRTPPTPTEILHDKQQKRKKKKKQN